VKYPIDKPVEEVRAKVIDLPRDIQAQNDEKEKIKNEQFARVDI